MSYIIKSTSPFVSIKLTETGRELLAQGKLTFNYWAIGDSEINYEREAIVDANPNEMTSAILRPLDRQPNIKSFITPEGASTPYNDVNSSVLKVIKAVVNNEATERGFFSRSGSTYTTQSGSTYTPYTTTIANTVLNGTNILTITTSAITVGDVLLIKLANTVTGNITPFANTLPIPNIWFKVQSVSATTVTLDRNLPNLSASATLSQVIVYRGGEVYESIATGNTTAYWDSGTLAFDSANSVTCNDVPVWNMNNVWCENLAGMPSTVYEDYTKFGSYRFLGTKNPYLEYLCDSTATTLNFSCNGTGLSYPDEVVKSVSIIHFTNNAISNLYGEYIYTDATNNKFLGVHLPDLMYHRHVGSTASGTTQGMKFVATGETLFVGNSDIQYINLVEDPSLISSAATSQIVGRMYPQLKTVVFHDDEIVSAMSYKSNRNWTLPELAAVLQAPSGGTSTGVLTQNETIYLTYSLDNSGATSGLNSSLPCQKYIKITNTTSSAKDVAFRISETDLLPYMRKIETGWDGYGFYAHNFKLLYQIMQDPTDRPDPSAWKEYDFTSTAITGGVGETINPILLQNQNYVTNGFVLDVIKHASSTTFDLVPLLNMPSNMQPEHLQFGDEKIFYGNITTFIGATIYKTLFDIVINSDEFKTTTNTTRSNDSSTNPPKIKVSEVGIYDANKTLVCIGKLSSPIALDGNTIMLELSMDF